MEAQEAADKIQEAGEAEHGRAEHFRRRAAVAIGVLAMLLAITAVSGEKASREVITANIQASDMYAFYQAKNIRQTANKLAADEAEMLLLSQPTLAPEARATIQKRIDGYKATVAHYESDPAKGEGKQELLAKARALEARRDHTEKQLPSFELAQGLYQIGIVLGSVAIVAGARWLLWLGLGLGAGASLLLLNGYLLLIDLPLG